MNTNKDNHKKRNFIYGILLVILASITVTKIPYQGKAISEIILPIIKFSNSTLYLSGLIPLVLIILSSHLIKKSGRYKNQFVVIVVLLFIALPLVGRGIDFLKTPVYMMGEGVRGIELKESDLNIYEENGEINVVFNAEAICHINEDRQFSIIVELPEAIQLMTKDNDILVYESNSLHKGYRINIDYTGTLDLVDGYEFDDLFEVDYYREDYTVILNDHEQSVDMKMNNGMF